MASIKDEAKAYMSPQTKNIAELDSISTGIQVIDETFNSGEENEFTIKLAKIKGVNYRVPISVLKSLKAILEVKPDLKTFKVQKTGTGMNTEYTVIPLE